MRSRQQLRKEKKIVTEQPESQSEAEENFVGFDSERGTYYVKRVQSGSRRLTL